jgi:hypothetical protein
MDRQAVVNIYANLMSAIKSRINILRDLIANHRRYPDLIVMEFIQLQIRMICETLAIGCLVTHGDIKASRSGKLTKTYKADLIINELERLHPDFYPRPTNQTTKNGLVGWEDISDPYLTKAELVASYRRTGNFLHIGHLQEVLSGKERTVDLLPSLHG